MPLSKKTKNARQLVNKRKKETPRSREMRLNNTRERMSQYYSQLSTEDKQQLSKTNAKNRSSVIRRETSAERDSRLATHRSRVSKKRNEESSSAYSFRLSQKRQRAFQRRADESPYSRELRLTKMREHTTIIRECESSDQRDTQLLQKREQAALTRALESPTSRDTRLTQMREYASLVREGESSISRDTRLTQMREYASLVRELESPISRDTRLTQMREYASLVRELESPISRDTRLTQMREYASLVRELESPISRDTRLTQMREYASMVRELESPISRDTRLTQMREYASLMRELESSISRDARLTQMREYASLVRELESSISRDARLTQMREYASLVRELESSISRDARLTQMREYASQVRELESPTSRETRLMQMQEHAASVREKETPYLRSERLAGMQRDYRSRRQIISDDSNFVNQISQVPESVCFSCKKLMYQKQTRRVSTTNNITVLPQDHPEVLVCCNRCANNILKNKTPPMAFWNNMSVAPVPPELECLNEMEVRLISRVRPFMKVVRLGGRFGQQGFKGQAILFAQQVEELPEQLPISTSDAGLTIVAESLENVSSTRRYCVDMNKIKNALKWLISNNHLYSNVQMNFTLTSDEVNECILQAVSTPDNHPVSSPNNQTNVQCHFKYVNDDRSILRGHFHQGSDRFGTESRGRQCTANAVVAIAYTALKPLPEWSPSDLDRVLLAGDNYYTQCVTRLPQRPNYLNTEELLPCLTICAIPLNTFIEPDVVIGLIGPTNPEAVPHEIFTSLDDGVQHFFNTFESGVLTCETQYAVAIFKRSDDYYLFDSHSRGPKGFVAGDRGTSMLMKISTVESLCRHLLIVLEVRGARNLQYCITAVSSEENNPTPVDETPAPVIDNNGDNNEEKDNSDSDRVGNDILSNLHDGEIVTTSLMPIDTDLPDINTVLPEVQEDQPVPVCQLKRKTAPPISVLREQRAEELAWVKLFPDGKNGFRENRQIPITPLDYFQTRVMSNEKRFQENEYLFFALSMVELYKAQQNVSVCGRLRQNGVETTNVVQNVHLVMRNIRGTQSYWHKAFTDLMAMVRNLGAPHFYITLSCNDLHWPDVLKALLVADGRPDFPLSQLSFTEKLRLVESYPVTLCRQFMVRLNTFFTQLKRQDDPLLCRPIVDFWWRIEFQLRGSPHVHMVVWCVDMPSFDSEEGIAILDQAVTCALPDLNEDPEMRELVSRLQTHKHTHTCYKNNANICRFGFPRPTAYQSRIVDENEATRIGGRSYVLKRGESEKDINNYNTRMLRMWQANMDIQPCGTATGIAYYITKYISKSEPAEVSKSIRESIRRVQAKGGNMAKQVFAMQNAILTHREVSACEAAVRLCHIKMRDSSRKVVFINSCTPELRYRMLRVDDVGNEPYRNIFDRYVSRPRQLEELSLGEFAVWYEPVTRNNYSEDDQDADAYEEVPEDNVQQRFISLLDNQGRMKKRNRPAVLRTRYYTPNSDPEAYYYSLLVSHVSFRSETELMDGYDSAKEAFYAKRNLVRPLQEGFSAEEMARWEQQIQQAISRVVAENLASNTNAVVADTEDGIFGENHFVADDRDGFLIDEVGEPEYHAMTDQQYATAVNSLNIQQRELFQKISEQLLLTDCDIEPLRVFVTGGAGTGKTFTLKLIVEQIRRLSHDMHKKAVAVTAPTGVAARLVGGATLHSTFALPIEKGRVETMRLLTGERLQRERQKWRSIQWLIVDEISMVPYTTLRNIHLRLQQMKVNDSYFGGINVLLFGDLMQLPPVAKSAGGAYCFKQPPHLEAEVDLWALFSFCELPQNMRQADDTTFVDILNSLRVGQLTMQQLEVLDQRRIPLTGPFADGECVRIFSTIKEVDWYNASMTNKLAKSCRMYDVMAVDVSVEAKTYGQHLKTDFIPSDANKTGGIPKFIKIGVGSRVMLRKNIHVSHGLVNGAMGIIRKIEWPALRRDQLETGELPQAVFVEFDDRTIPENAVGVGVKIEPSTVEFDALRGQGKVERRMLPLILCWAVTVHKLQGTTLDRAVVNLGPKIFAKGQAYVALSRVRQLEGLAISILDPRKVIHEPHDKKSLEELNRLRNLNR